MTSIKQFYLLKLAEECSEIAQQACKQIQFGHYPTSPSTGKAYDNLQLLRGEVNDLLAVLDVLMQLGELPKISPAELVAAKDKKRARILDYLRHSQELGLVEKDVVVTGCIECDYCGNHIPL
jgi:NTP pyrophosphatase (non-canonical NTP hydrolase)